MVFRDLVNEKSVKICLTLLIRCLADDVTGRVELKQCCVLEKQCNHICDREDCRICLEIKPRFAKPHLISLISNQSN